MGDRSSYINLNFFSITISIYLSKGLIPLINLYEKNLNKKIARLGLYFYIINMILVLIFPKLLGNFYYLFSFIMISLVLIFFIYRKS